MSTLIKSIALIAIILTLCYKYVVPTVVNEINTIYQEHIDNTECIRTLVSEGVERKDIDLVRGKCIVELNAYYKY